MTTLAIEHPTAGGGIVDQDHDGTDAAVLATEIDRKLSDLGALLPLVDKLVDSHQRGLSFLSPDAKDALDHAAREEKAHRVDTNPRFQTPGLQWMRGTTGGGVLGAVGVPGNVTAISAQADITFTVHDLTRRIRTSLAKAGICPLSRLAADATTQDRLEHLSALVWVAPDVASAAQLLRSVDRDLEHLVGLADLVVNGNDKTTYGDCPHCRRPTVVVYFRPEFLIRCDRDQKTGHYEPCVCRDPDCLCKYKPTTFRHTWQKERPHAHDGVWKFDRLRRQADETTTTTTPVTSTSSSSPSTTSSSATTSHDSSKEPQQ